MFSISWVLFQAGLVSRTMFLHVALGNWCSLASCIQFCEFSQLWLVFRCGCSQTWCRGHCFVCFLAHADLGLCQVPARGWECRVTAKPLLTLCGLQHGHAVLHIVPVSSDWPGRLATRSREVTLAWPPACCASHQCLLTRGAHFSVSCWFCFLNHLQNWCIWVCVASFQQLTGGCGWPCAAFIITASYGHCSLNFPVCGYYLFAVSCWISDILFCFFFFCFYFSSGSNIL